ETLASLVRSQPVAQLAAPGRGDAGGVADVVEDAVLAVEAEQKRPRKSVGGGDPVASDHAVGGAMVLHLDHDPLAGPVGLVGAFGDDTVETGSLEAGEPGRGQAGVAGLRG